MRISLTADQVASRLEQLLFTPDYTHDGERLPPERALAGQFGVGRPLIREVLRRLQERGLITVIPGKGTFVRQAKLTENGTSVDVVARRGQVTPRHLISARLMLESQAAFLAAENRTDADLDLMSKLLEILAKSNHAQQTVDADLRFHEAIAMASANPVVQIMFGSIRNLIQGVIVRSLSDPGVREEGVPSHWAVLDAIRLREPEDARLAMLAHLNIAQHFYGTDLDQPLTSILASSLQVRGWSGGNIEAIMSNLTRE